MQLQKQKKTTLSSRSLQNIKLDYKLHLFQNGQYSLFLYYNYKHPIDMKEEFAYGYMRLFSESKLFSNQISSQHHINSGFDWDKEFFEKVLEGFKKFSVQRKEEDDEHDNSLDLLIYENKGDIQETLMKIGLVQEIGKDIHKQFWREFAIFNEYKSNQIKLKQEANELLARKRTDNLQRLINYQDQCQKQKHLLIGRLSAILLEKIHKLNQFGQEFSIKSFDQKINDFQRMQQQPPIMSTYQEQKAFTGSLFEPSQNFYQ